MNVKKRVIGSLAKCYCVASLNYKGRECLLVAAEKHDACHLYDLDGNFIETVWDEPGGTMSMVQVPGSDGQFLATHGFYSPNDSAQARIVLATPKGGKWEIQKLVDIPFVHRFDILSRNGLHYLIACTIKSAHICKDDWSSPGKVYAAVLPDKLEDLQPLELEIIYEGLIKNHGYSRTYYGGVESAVISAEQGVFLFTPPSGDENSKWGVQQLSNMPTSEALFVDLDMDGTPELFTFSPFHGATMQILKKEKDGYQIVYNNDSSTPFLHAICTGEIKGNPVVFIGCRHGSQGLNAIFYNSKEKKYRSEEIDSGCGPANILFYRYNGGEYLLAANRETDEIALYSFQSKSIT